MNSGKPLIVAREGSENTIFGDRDVNFAFRAWHDWCHWRGGYDFSFLGECATCHMQVQQLKEHYGKNHQTAYWIELLTAEVVGQRQFYEKFKTYISDQRAFAQAYLQDPGLALGRIW